MNAWEILKQHYHIQGETKIQDCLDCQLGLIKNDKEWRNHFQEQHRDKPRLVNCNYNYMAFGKPTMYFDNSTDGHMPATLSLATGQDLYEHGIIKTRYPPIKARRWQPEKYTNTNLKLPKPDYYSIDKAYAIWQLPKQKFLVIARKKRFITNYHNCATKYTSKLLAIIATLSITSAILSLTGLIIDKTPLIRTGQIISILLIPLLVMQKPLRKLRAKDYEYWQINPRF